MAYTYYKDKLYPVSPRGPVAPAQPELQQPVQPIGPQKPVGFYKPYFPDIDIEASNILDYNDPYEINSVADIILTTFNPDMQRNDFGIEALNLPRLNIIPSTLDYLYRSTIKPIAEGDWAAVGINALTNFGETLDIVANPVKGLIMEGPQGFMDAIGYGGQGRRNFDADTGHWSTDLIAELFLDPLNWVTLFGKGAVTAVTKSFLRNIIEAVGKETGQEVSEKAVKGLAKKLSGAFLEGMQKAPGETAVKFAKQMMKHPIAPAQFTDEFIKGLQALQLDDTSLTVLKGLYGNVIQPVEAFESAAFKAALGVPYVTGFLAKISGKPVAEFIHAKLTRKLEPFKTPSGNVDVLKYADIKNEVHKFAVTLQEILEFQDVIPNEETVHKLITEALMREKKVMEHYIYTELKDLPNVNMEGKVALFRKFLAENEIDGELLMETLVDLNNKTKGKYKATIDWFKQYLDPALARKADERQAAWAKANDIKEVIKTLREDNTPNKLQVLEQHLAAKYSMTLIDYAQELQKLRLDFADEFKWIDDMFSDAPKKFQYKETDPIWQKKYQLEQQIRKFLENPKELEAGSRYKMLDDYIKAEHGVSIEEYIERLKEINKQYNDVFDEHLKYVELQKRRLTMIDDLNQRYARAEKAKAKIKMDKKLQDTVIKTWTDFPERVVEAFRLFQEGYTDGLNVYDITKVLEKQGMKAPEARQAVINQIKNVYDYMVKENLKVLDSSDLMNNKHYIGYLNGMRKLFDKQWKELEKDMAKQMRHGYTHLELGQIAGSFQDASGRTVTTDFTKQLNEYVSKTVEKITGQELMLPTILQPNKLTSFQAEQAAAQKEMQELFDNIQNTLSGINDIPELKHLRKKVRSLERKMIVHTTDIQKFQKEFAKDIKSFFTDFGAKFEVSEELGRDWLRAQGVDQTPIGQLIEAWSEAIQKKHRDIHIPFRFRIAFEDLFEGFETADYIMVAHAADELVITMRGMSLHNPATQRLVAPLLDVFEKYKLSDYLPVEFQLEADKVWYRFKLEQEYILSLMMSDTTINDYIENLSNPGTELGNKFKNLMAAGDEEALMLADSLKSYNNYLGFMKDLYEYVGNLKDTMGLTIDHDMLGAFRSTIQKYARMSPEVLANNLESKFFYIMQQVEDQINTIKMRKSLSLDKLVDELKLNNRKLKLVLDKLDAHHAWDDAVRTYHVVKDEGLEEVLKKKYGDDVVVLHLDIETTGFEGSIHELTELGVYGDAIKNDKRFEFVRTSGIKAQERAEVAVTLRDPNLIGDDSEQQMLLKIVDLIDQFEGQNVVFNMHNGFRFDKKFIMERLKYHALSTKNPMWEDAIVKIKQTHFEDSYKLLQEKYGYTVIPYEDRLALYYALDNFIQNQTGMEQLIQPIDPRLAKRLKDIGQKLIDENDDAGLKFLEHAGNIYEFFKGIKRANRDMNRLLLDKSIFEDSAFQQLFGLNMSQALYKIDSPLVGPKLYGYKKALDTNAVLEYFNFTTDTRLKDYEMDYYTSIARSIDQEYKQLRHGNRLLGYHDKMKEILTAFIKEAQKSMDIPNGLKNLRVTDDALSNFAILRVLSKYKSAAFDGHGNILDGLVHNLIPEDLRFVLQNPEKTVRVKAYLDDGSLEQAVDLKMKAAFEARQAARNTEREVKFAALKEEWAQQKAEKLDREYELFTQKMRAEEIKTDRAIERELNKELSVKRFLAKLDMPDEMANYEAYLKSIDDSLANYSDLIESLEHLERSWDEGDAYRAVVQVRATALKETFNMLKLARERHAKVSTVEEHFSLLLKHREVLELMNFEQIRGILKLSDGDLYAHLVNEGRRLLVLDGTALSAEQIQSVLNRTAALEALQIHTKFEGDAIYLYLDKSVKITTDRTPEGVIKHFANGVYQAPPKLFDIDIEGIVKATYTDPSDLPLAESIIKIYKQMYNLLGDLDSGYSPHFGSTGELITKQYFLGRHLGEAAEDFNGLYDNLPDSIKKELPHPDVMYADELFHDATFNHSVLGDAAFRRKFYKFTNSDVISSLTKAMTMQVKHLDSKLGYINMLFDKSLSINNGHLAGRSAEEILNALQMNDEFRLVALVNDNKKAAKLIDLNPKTVADIENARRLDAVLMSYQTYSKAYATINSWRIRHSKLNLWHKINYLYKAGVLLTPGAIMRNMIDSAMKNFLIAKEDPLGMVQSFQTAYQLYWKYYRTAEDLIKFSRDPVTMKARVTEEKVKEFFKSGAARLTKDEYDFLHGFYMDGPSGGMIRPWEKYYQHDKQFGMYGTVIQAINFAMQPMALTEQIVRLAEYMWAIEKGMPTTQAYKLIAKTHFDYALKNDMERTIELLFPFYTFTMNNLHFWVDAFDDIPWLGSVLRDVYTPIWNFDGHTEEEIRYNRSLQYQFLSGNLPLSESGLTLKLNPSFMDVFNMATDPINAIKGKLSVPAQAIINTAGQGAPDEMKYAYGFNATSEGWEALYELLPIAGPILNRLLEQGPKYYARTGNLLNLIAPSIFGATAQTNFKPYSKQKSQWINYPDRPKKPKKVYGKRYFPKSKRYYAKARKSFASYNPKLTRYNSQMTYYAENFYQKLYTKNGKSRIRSMMGKLSPQTLEYRLRDMVNYYRKR